MRKKLSLLMVAFFAVAAFAAVQAVRRAPVSLEVPTGTELGALIKSMVEANPGVDVTLKLAAGGTYTLTTDPKQLPVDAAFTITSDASNPATITWGNKPLRGGKALTIENVIIDATSGEGHIINMLEPTTDAWGEGTVSGSNTFWTIDAIKFDNIQVKGLKKAFFLDQNKSNRFIVKNFEINNSIFEIVSPANVTINLQAAAVEKFTITNSTVYNKATETGKGFLGIGGTRIWQAPGYESTAEATITFENNTFYYNQTQTAQFFNTNAYKNQKQAKIIWKKNIFVGIPTNTFEKFINGASTAAAMLTTEDNTYMNVDGTFWSDTKGYGIPAGIESNPNFKDAANGDFTVAMASDQYTKQTGDPRWLNATAEDITVSPTSGDIAAAINEAQVYAPAKDITINLTKGVTYTLSESIVAPGNVTINGNGATIDANNNNDGAFILMSKTPAIEANGSSAYIIDNVTIKDVTINNLKGSLFYDNKVKYGVNDFTIDNVVVQLNESAVNYESIIAFEGGGTKAFTIKNSTVYGTGTNVSKYFFRYGGQGRLDRLGYDKNSEIQSWTYTNNTFYNVLKSDGQWGNGQNGQKYMAYYVDNNIWYNCGDSNQSILSRLGFGRIATTYTSFTLNTFFNGDQDNSVKETLETDALKTNPGFADAANGDFTLDKTSDQYANATGDPRWIIYDIQTALTVGSNGSATVNPTEAAAGTTVTVKTTSAKAKYVPIVTATDKDGNQITVTASKAYNASDKTAEFTIVVPVGGIKTIDVQFEEQPVPSSAAIEVEVPANLGAMDGTNGPTDLALFLDSYLQNSANPAYIKLTLQGGANYIISKPLTIMSAIQILGSDANNPATIDATALGANPFVKIQSEDEATPAMPNDLGFYTTIYNVEFKNFKLTGLKGQAFYANAQKYIIPTFTVDNSIIEVAGGNKNIFDFSGNGSGVVASLTINNSTISSPATAHTGALFSSQSGTNPDKAGLTEQKFTITNSTIYNIAYKNKTFSLCTAGKKELNFTVKNSVIINSGNSGQFVKGMNGGQSSNIPSWLAQYNSFNFDGVDTSEAEESDANISVAGSIKGVVVFANESELTSGNLALGVCPQREAKIGDPRWFNAAMKISTADLDDDKDLAKAINQGVENGITKFLLDENARYSVKQTIVADKAIAITGKNVIIDVEHNDPFILLSKTPTGGFMPKASTEAAAPALNRAAGVEYTDYYKFDELTLSGLKVNGLKNSIIYDNNVKYCVIDLTIDDCVMQLETEAVKNDALIAFQAGGVNNLTIKNSTFYGNNEVAKYFVRYNNSARIDRFGFDKADNTWSFTYENNTFYGLLKSDGQWGNYNGIAQKTPQFIVTVKNNIWYNCDAQTMRRLLHSKNFSQFSKASQMENNTFIVGGEAVDQGNYGNGSDLTGEPGFKRPAEGDFTLSAYSVQFDKKTGDPRWYADGGHYNPVTGIEGVEAEKADDGAWYTIQGVRVDKPAKGLYIHNGKKVVVK